LFEVNGPYFVTNPCPNLKNKVKANIFSFKLTPMKWAEHPTKHPLGKLILGYKGGGVPKHGFQILLDDNFSLM